MAGGGRVGNHEGRDDPRVPARRRRLDAILEEIGAAALVVAAPSAGDPDLAPFVGPVHLGPAILVVPSGSEPSLGYFTPMEREEAARTGLRTLSPEALELDRWSRERPEAGTFLAAVLRCALDACGLRGGRLAVAGHWPGGTLHTALRELEAEGFETIDGNDVVRRMAQRKTLREIAAVERAAAGTGAALRRVAEILAHAGDRDGTLWFEGERLTVGRLRQEISISLARHELAQPRGNIVAPGAEGAVPHNEGDSARVLRPAESLIVDLYPHRSLFADCTRTFCVGEPPAALVDAHGAVETALERAEAAALPGVRGFGLHEATCAFFAERGYDTALSRPGTVRGYVHGLGHGVGYELHDYPSFRKSAGAEGVLGEGDVVTLEPGLYDPEGGWAVRLEDLYLVEPHGARSLTPLPRALDPRAWL